MEAVASPRKNNTETENHSENKHLQSNEDIIERLDRGVQSPQEKIEGLIESPR